MIKYHDRYRSANDDTRTFAGRYRKPHRNGAVLIIVLIAVLLIALAAYGFTFKLRSEYRMTKSFVAAEQARSAGSSAIEFSRVYFERPNSSQSNEIQTWVGIELEPGNELGTEELLDWRFGVVHWSIDKDEARFQPGWQNESAKINLISLIEWENEYPGHARSVLERLPGMDQVSLETVLEMLGIGNQAVASDSFVSQNQRASTTTANIGSATRTQPNTRPDSEAIDADSPANMSDKRLLALMNLLEGGLDSNANHQIDPWEAGVRDGEVDDSVQADSRRIANEAMRSRNGESTEQDWRDWVTLVSGERLERLDGNEKIDLNSSDLQQLYQQLLDIGPTNWAQFVVLYRQYGPSGGGSSSSVGTVAIDFGLPGKFAIDDPLDLVDRSVSVTVDSKPQQILSPWQTADSRLPSLLERLLVNVTSEDKTRRMGRIDLFEAPTPVLAAVPGLSTEAIDKLLGARQSWAESIPPRSIAWLLEEQVVDFTQLKQIAPYVTVRGDVYRGQVYGYRDDQSPIYRAQVVIDATVVPAQVLQRKELHSFGRIFSCNQLDHIGTELVEIDYGNHPLR